MFKHQFKVKTNTNVRNSDRKKIIAKIGENSSEIFGKSALSVANIVLGSGSLANVYICDKQPVFFEPKQGELYPTVYLAWKSPKSFPTMFISEPVLAFLLNGADLMLPGVILRQDLPFFEFKKDDPVCISVYSEKKRLVQGPMAVGKALLSSEDMIKNGMKGKGVQILHIIHDELWEFGLKGTSPIYELSVLTSRDSEENNLNKETENVDEITEKIENVDVKQGEDEEFVELPPETTTESNNQTNVESESAESQEEFLRKVFLYALRYKLPEDQKYPLDVGQFYATVILKSIPEGKRIEIKKTKYKKFSVFLNEVNKTAGDGNWFVKITSKKGLDSITEFNLSHPEVVNAERFEESSIVSSTKTGKVKVADCYTLTDSSLSMVKLMNPKTTLKKGELLHPNEVTELVKEYASSKDLLKPGNKAELDDVLQTIAKKFTTVVVPINEIVQQLTTKMTKAYLITTPDGRRMLRKTQIPQIVLKVEKRSGNKSVTLVNNLSPFGIDCKEFSQKVQHGLSTGATIHPEAQQCVGPQVLVLGNQVNFIVDLLSDNYGLQKKFINGAELGVKTKKGKK